MATSGALLGDTVEGSENSYLDWQLASQNVTGNYSTINWQAGWRFDQYSCRGLRQGSAVINGTTVYSDQDGGDGVHSYNGGHSHGKLQTASGSRTINHNVDGTKTFSASVTMNGWQGQVSNGSASWALPTIPRISSAPSKPVITLLSSTAMTATFTDGGGGAPIDARQIGYGTNSVTPSTIIASDGSTLISGLTPGTVYYIWARTHNVAGYSAWSARATATTHAVPDAPSTVAISQLTQVSLVGSWSPNFDGGTPITSYQLGYGTSDVAPVTIISAVSPQAVTGFTPGVRYYFWARAINNVGTGPWSVRSDITMIAGARVKVGAVWKTAVPYVRVGGVWKVARPWVRSIGVWKETM